MVVPDRPIHLDALIGLVCLELATANGAEHPLEALNSLPLERYRQGDAWVWKASQFLLEQEGGIFWNHYVRVYDIQRWAADGLRGGIDMGRRNQIPSGSGHQKAYSFNQPLAHIRRATAWFVGDGEAVESLLKSSVYALGKNRRSGWGRIDRIDVTQAPAGESEFWRRRSIPQEFETLRLDGHYLTSANTKPPYWDRSTVQPAYEFELPASVTVLASTA
jgi:CRISPR type IV-associated protein Csf3